MEVIQAVVTQQGTVIPRINELVLWGTSEPGTIDFLMKIMGFSGVNSPSKNHLKNQCIDRMILNDSLTDVITPFCVGTMILSYSIPPL